MRYHSRDVHPSALGSRESRLAGTGRVADELYLIGHHEVTGRPRLSPRSAGIGVAGGLLAELMVVPVVTVQRGSLFPLSRQDGGPLARHAHPDEPVTRHVLDMVMAESEPRPVRDWLLFLGMTSAAEVAGRLERSGYLTRPASRIPWRAPRPVPANRDWSHCALLRARAGWTRPACQSRPQRSWPGSPWPAASGSGSRLSRTAPCGPWRRPPEFSRARCES